MTDNILEELNNKYLHKQFKYYGINGLCDWVGIIEEVGYLTQYSREKEYKDPTIIEWLVSKNSIYYLNEILILENDEPI